MMQVVGPLRLSVVGHRRVVPELPAARARRWAGLLFSLPFAVVSYEATARAQPVRIETRSLPVVLEREDPAARTWDRRFVRACDGPVCDGLARGVRYRIGGALISPSEPFALISGPVLLRVDEASRAANQVSLGILLTGATAIALGLSLISAWPLVRWDPVIVIGAAIAGGGAVVAGAGGVLLSLHTTRVAMITQGVDNEVPAIRVTLLRRAF